MEFLTPAQINVINLYEKYWILIHRRFKWKVQSKTSASIGRYKAEAIIPLSDTIDSSRRRKRKASQSENNVYHPANKAIILNSSVIKGK